jgi:hypothetical protein
VKPPAATDRQRAASLLADIVGWQDELREYGRPVTALRAAPLATLKALAAGEDVDAAAGSRMLAVAAELRDRLGWDLLDALRPGVQRRD